MSDEEFVRAHWERADLCENRSRASFTTSLGGRGFTRVNIPERQVDSAKRAWAAAAKFTRERLEQIRQLGRQIEWCRAGLSDWYDPIYWHWDENEREEESVLRTRASNAREDVTGRLIVARLESALADLKRGMKPTP